MSSGMAGTSCIVRWLILRRTRTQDQETAGVPECSRMRIAPFLMALMPQNKCFTLPLVFRETAWDLGSDRPFP